MGKSRTGHVIIYFCGDGVFLLVPREMLRSQHEARLPPSSDYATFFLVWRDPGFWSVSSLKEAQIAALHIRNMSVNMAMIASPNMLILLSIS
jgi:hypothetical protein